MMRSDEKQANPTTETPCAYRGGPPWQAHGGVPGGKDRPPWWPNDLDWPPDEESWQENRRKIFRRFALSMSIFTLFICIIGWLFSSIVFGNADHGFHPWKFAGIGVILVTALLTASLIMGRVRRAFVSVVDVMEAADRVATGNYSVRVVPRGKGEVRQLAVSFNAMVGRLELNDEQRRRLLADIAHELRTPLAVIQGTLEAIIDGVYPSDTEHIEPMLTEISVITRLLEDLQLLAHAEAGGLALERSSVDLAMLLSEVSAAFQPQALQRDLTINEQVTPLPEVNADPIRIRQILENLVSNALRYTPAGGSVTLRASQTGNEIVIEVEDTGAGMTDDERAHMFDRFVKSADSGGSGLGLAIAKSLVEAHGGAIHAEAAPNGGTIVGFSVPMQNS